MFKSSALCIGLTELHQCSYLKDQQERVAVLLEPELHTMQGHDAMIQVGFRRSGETLYRPQCPNCNACESIRVDAKHFKPNRSQKRQLKNLDSLDYKLKNTLDSNWFELYEHYITKRHQTGSMFPANKKRFLEFVETDWQETQYLHLYQEGELIAVAVTDILPQSWSALYSFFAPNHEWSLGTICILAQITLAKAQNIPWLYLGFQIDQCQAMKYKKNFKPNQRYINEIWQDQS